MDTKPQWYVWYKTQATDIHGHVEVKMWGEVWSSHVRPTMSEVQGYWTYLIDSHTVKVTVFDFGCESLSDEVTVKRAVEV